MDESKKEDILHRYYYNPKNPASYGGADKLFSVLDKKYPETFTIGFIRKWVNDQDAYSLQKQRRHRFKTANVRVSSLGEQLDVDLLSMFNISKENDDIRYLLCAIDVLSRKLWVRPLKNKTAKVVIEAMKDILDEINPTKIQKVRADKGSEFANKWFRKLMKENNIYFFTTNNPPKSNFVERVQRTLKEKIYRMMRYKRTYRYIDDLKDIVNGYNSSPHRSLKGLSPNAVNKHNEADVWATVYLKKSKLKKSAKPSFKFNKGDLVRVSFTKQPFQRAYQEQFSTEVFKVIRRRLMQGIPMYNLADLQGEQIEGLFYNAELQKVNKDENSLWFIEKILRKRKRNKKLQYFVRWQGFSDKFDSWVEADEIKDLGDLPS